MSSVWGDAVRRLFAIRVITSEIGQPTIAILNSRVRASGHFVAGYAVAADIYAQLFRRDRECSKDAPRELSGALAGFCRNESTRAPAYGRATERGKRRRLTARLPSTARVHLICEQLWGVRQPPSGNQSNGTGGRTLNNSTLRYPCHRRGIAAFPGGPAQKKKKAARLSGDAKSR